MEIFKQNSPKKDQLIDRERHAEQTDGINRAVCLYSIFKNCSSETCSIDINENICYVMSTVEWL